MRMQILPADRVIWSAVNRNPSLDRRQTTSSAVRANSRSISQRTSRLGQGRAEVLAQVGGVAGVAEHRAASVP
jgi:hypothetical protein